jgi:hypothetical protein
LFSTPRLHHFWCIQIEGFLKGLKCNFEAFSHSIHMSCSINPSSLFLPLYPCPPNRLKWTARLDSRRRSTKTPVRAGAWPMQTNAGFSPRPPSSNPLLTNPVSQATLM